MPALKIWIRAVPGVIASLSLAGCGQPDPRALQRMACEQARANLDLQSVSQLDGLRKALGLAPDVDPVGFCRSIGVPFEPAPGSPEPSGEAQPGSEARE